MALNDQLISHQAKIWWEAEMKILANRKKREREQAQKSSPPKEKSSN